MALKLLFSKGTRETSGVSGSQAMRPMLVHIATLDASKKSEALAYARGLAESIVDAKDVCYLYVVDLGGERWLYEIHEGGGGRSLAKWALSQLETREKVSIALAGNRASVVTKHDGHIVTLLVQEHSRDNANVLSVDEPVPEGDSDVTMEHFYGPARVQRDIALSAFCVSSVVLSVAGVLGVLRSNAIDPLRLVNRYAESAEMRRTELKNLPSVQLSQAIKGLEPKAGYLSSLRFKDGKWTWAQASAPPTTALANASVPDPRPELESMRGATKKGAPK
ncbi:hypothetical protein [Acidovorax sp.]|uniref:hypothetical protein n=1 Tax=Acidovorax sp. TaxID=1872122 RepID=UPI00391F7495